MNYLFKNLMLITRETWAGLMIWALIVGSVAWMNVRKTGWTWRNVVPLVFLALVGACGAAIVNPVFLSARAAANFATTIPLRRALERMIGAEDQKEFDADVATDFYDGDYGSSPYVRWRPLLLQRRITRPGRLLSLRSYANRWDGTPREIAIVTYRLEGRGDPVELRVTGLGDADGWKVAAIH
ncbi:hypothetical protein EON77_01500 [bacterium]|nr:MAG: hypothetical protein EON77_01500 [bacterium]